MNKTAVQTNPSVTWSGVVQCSAVGRWSAEVSALVFIWPVLAAAAVGPGYWEHFSNHGQQVLGYGYCRQHQNNSGQQTTRLPPCQNWLQLIWLTDMNSVSGLFTTTSSECWAVFLSFPMQICADKTEESVMWIKYNIDAGKPQFPVWSPACSYHCSVSIARRRESKLK